MENIMENENKVSQLPMIGKVFKYEFISTARVFVPVYSVILAIAFIAGILYFSQNFFDDFGGDKVMLFYFVLYPVMMIFVVASAIITLLQLGRRFKKSMLGNEAYLNLTLPVSLWGHLLARILSAFVWLLIYSIVVGVSTFLLYRNVIDKLLEDKDFADLAQRFVEFTGHSIVNACFLFGVAGIFTIFFIATFIYMVYAVGHLAKKCRALVQFIVAVVGLSIMNTIQGQFTTNFLLIKIENFNSDSPAEVWNIISTMCYASIGFDILFSVACAGITLLILRNKLNLE
jgi:hypothetical protein